MATQQAIDDYNKLKNKLGRVPLMREYQEHYRVTQHFMGKMFKGKWNKFIVSMGDKPACNVGARKGGLPLSEDEAVCNMPRCEKIFHPANKFNKRCPQCTIHVNGGTVSKYHPGGGEYNMSLNR